MVTTPCCLARSWIALPESGSRSVMSRTPTPALIIDWACACMVWALPLALSMMQFSLYLMHWALSSLGSADTQRGDEAVSGSRMPTLLFVAVVLPELLLLLLQAATPATASAATAAIVKTLRGVVRIAACLLP